MDINGNDIDPTDLESSPLITIDIYIYILISIDYRFFGRIIKHCKTRSR